MKGRKEEKSGRMVEGMKEEEWGEGEGAARKTPNKADTTTPMVAPSAQKPSTFRPRYACIMICMHACMHMCVGACARVRLQM